MPLKGANTFPHPHSPTILWQSHTHSASPSPKPSINPTFPIGLPKTNTCIPDDSSKPSSIPFYNLYSLMGTPNRTIKKLNMDLVNYILIVICLQMIPYVLIYCIEECSPLVLFSWWRNKIS